MTLTFVWVGKTKNRHWAALEQTYLTRINYFTGSVVKIVKESDPHDAAAKRLQNKTIEKYLKAGATTIVLDESGTHLSSGELAERLAGYQRNGVKEIVFIVGGAAGLSPELRRHADLTLSLSRMTLPHEMARVILLEQIYRAFCILNHLPYHR